MTTTEAPQTAGGTRRITTAKAMAEAIALEMRANPDVFVMGEDVGAYGGIFGSTTDLFAEFGSDRVIDTPISETAFIGAGIGAAVEGMRPVVELMFIDFYGVCMDQITNHMAKIHYESGGAVKVPMVLMSATGAGYSDAAQHSQSLWGTFAHLPGIKVVAPSNPYDAKGLMASAIRDDNPVLYLFHKGAQGLVWMAKNPRSIAHVPEEAYTVPIGEAAVAREGSDVTIVTLSLSVQHSLDVAEELEGEGLSVEVVDLRSLVPLDTETVLNSVAKTGKLLVVDEDYKSYGMTGEIAAIVAETDPTILSKPMKRLAVPDVPIPYARTMEYGILPTRDKIAAAVKELAS